MGTATIRPSCVTRWSVGNQMTQMAVATQTAAASAAASPLARSLAVRVGAVVSPDERRVHLRPTPTLGGLAMFVGFLAGMAVASRMHQFHPVFQGTSEPAGVILGATVIFGLGT